jgi:hypothetical protein
VATTAAATVQVYGLRLSTGGLQDILARLREHLALVCEEFRTQTRRSPVQHMDETGWRQDGQNGYPWVQATDGPAATMRPRYMCLEYSAMRRVSERERMRRMRYSSRARYHRGSQRGF